MTQAELAKAADVSEDTGNLDRACDLITRAPKDFALYSGDDMTCVASILLGFHGNISVTANGCAAADTEDTIPVLGEIGPGCRALHLGETGDELVVRKLGPSPPPGAILPPLRE